MTSSIDLTRPASISLTACCQRGSSRPAFASASIRLSQASSKSISTQAIQELPLLLFTGSCFTASRISRPRCSWPKAYTPQAAFVTPSGIRGFAHCRRNCRRSSTLRENFSAGVIPQAKKQVARGKRDGDAVNSTAGGNLIPGGLPICGGNIRIFLEKKVGIREGP